MRNLALRLASIAGPSFCRRRAREAGKASAAKRKALRAKLVEASRGNHEAQAVPHAPAAKATGAEG